MRPPRLFFLVGFPLALLGQESEEARAARGGTRAALSRELVDLIIHGPHIDAARSRTLPVTYRPLDETLRDFDGARAQFEAVAAGAYDFVQKPFKPEEIVG